MAVSTVDIYPSGPLIAMLGNPNAGKTSLFNILTGSKQKVANYAGVTVERVEGQLIGAPEKIRVLDLPGTYSFHPRSPDEKVTVDVLKGIARGERRPDLVVCVLDATNLRRGLKLVMAAQRLKLPAVVAVNMMDLARRRGIELKAEDLSRELGVPVVETIAVRKQGIDRLTELLSDPSAWSSWVPEATEEDDLARLNRILRKLGLDKIFPDEFSDRIDRVVLNPWLGVTILMIILFFVFQAVFAWSAYPMEWIEEGFNMLGELCAEHLPDGFVKDLLVDAVIGGVGGVVVFLPQILILFFFILLMEESGYLPRAAFLLDRTMGSVGLSGRSFLPLLSGYACAVPAIMAARIVGNQRDRWATIAIAPLLTCGARLPVYAVMIAAFVPDVSVWGVGLQGLVLFALYCLGMVGALVVAWILKHTTGKGENRTLMLELPSYHLPRIDALAHGLWQRACIYLQKVGTIILALTVFLWVLTTFPGAPAGATDTASRACSAARWSPSLRRSASTGRCASRSFPPWARARWPSRCSARSTRPRATRRTPSCRSCSTAGRSRWASPSSPSSFSARRASRRSPPSSARWAPGRRRPSCGWPTRSSLTPSPSSSTARPSGSAAKPGKGAVEGRTRTIRAPAADATGARIVFRIASR